MTAFNVTDAQMADIMTARSAAADLAQHDLPEGHAARAFILATTYRLELKERLTTATGTEAAEIWAALIEDARIGG